MRLMELFSVPNAADDEKHKKFDRDVDYINDLKFWIDNSDKALSNYIFPAVKHHYAYPDHPESFTHYIEPLKKCAEEYCREFDLMPYKEEIFNDEEIKKLAERVATEQTEHMHKGDYKNETY